MSNRSLDMGLVDMLRNMQTRIERLEAQNSAVRKNDIRLGDMVVTADREFNRICLKNLITGDEVCIGDPDDAEFSYSGVLVVSGDETDISLPYLMPQTSVAKSIVLAQTENLSEVTVDVYFNSGRYAKRVILPFGSLYTIEQVNIPVGINQSIFVKLIDVDDAESGSRDLSVIIRFGTPTSPTRTDISAP